jgi:hypothetical protein
MRSRLIPSEGIATGRSADLSNAEHVTQVGKVLRCAQDDTVFDCDSYLVEPTICQIDDDKSPALKARFIYIPPIPKSRFQR